MQARSAEGDGDAHISLPREAISCPLCEEPFETEEPRKPCVLPCFHTFCRHCLVGWAAQGGGGAAAAGADGGGGGGWSCPTCRAVCDTGVGALQVNFALMTVIEAERSPTGAGIDSGNSCAIVAGDPSRSMTTAGTAQVGASGALDCDGYAAAAKVRKKRDNHHTNLRIAAIECTLGRQSICVQQMWDMVLQVAEAAKLFLNRNELSQFLQRQSEREGKGAWLEATIRHASAWAGAVRQGLMVRDTHCSNPRRGMRTIQTSAT
jgi:hypothetical protein